MCWSIISKWLNLGGGEGGWVPTDRGWSLANNNYITFFVDGFIASCPDLPPLANSQTHNIGYPDTALSTIHGSVVLYFCNAFYILRGANRFECVDGKWEPLPDSTEAQSIKIKLDSDNPFCFQAPNYKTAKVFAYSIRTPRQYAKNIRNGRNQYVLTVSTLVHST